MIGSLTTGAWDATRNMAEAMAAPFRTRCSGWASRA
jgi:hypothetical protein